MSKILAGLAVLAALVVLSLPVPASAAVRTDGIRTVDQTDVSSAKRKKRRHVRRYYAPGPYWGWGWGPWPYYGYSYPSPRIYYDPGRPWPWW
jgi:hypothetical protein